MRKQQFVHFKSILYNIILVYIIKKTTEELKKKQKTNTFCNFINTNIKGLTIIRLS